MFDVQNSKFAQKEKIVTFDDATGEVKVSGNTLGKIRKNTDQFELCNVVLKNGASKKKTWEWDEILNKWHMDNLDNLKAKKMKVYRAAREINKKIAQVSEYKEFYIFTTNTLQLNPIFK